MGSHGSRAGGVGYELSTYLSAYCLQNAANINCVMSKNIPFCISHFVRHSVVLSAMMN